jgi:hypothetical protein
VKRSVVAAFLSLGAFASGALAAEFSVKGSVSQSGNINTNTTLASSSSGLTEQTTSAINLDFLAATPTTRYDLATNLSYSRYYGAGNQNSLSYQTPMGAVLNIDHTANATTKFNSSGSWQRSDSQSTTLQQTGTASGSGSIDTYNFGGGFNRQLGLTDTVSWAVHGSTVSYSASTQQPYFDYTSNIDLKHNLSAATALTGSVSADWYMANDAQDSQRLYWNLTGGIQSQLTKRLFIYATAGVGLVNAWKKGDSQPAAPVDPNAPLGFGGLPFTITAGAAQDWLANLAMNYRVNKYDTASLTVTRSIAPSVIGQLLKVESVALSYTHALDNYSSLNLSTQFSHAEAAAAAAGAGGAGGSGAGAEDFLSANVGYSRTLGRDWTSSLSYSFSQSQSQSGTALSHSIALSVTRNFNLYGKPPTEAQKTQSEIAAQNLQRAQQVLPFTYVVPGIPR